MLVLLYFAFRFIAPNLLVERIEELLPGCRSCKRGAVVERSAEAAEVQQSFRRAIERHAHAIEQVDDPGRRVAHRFHRRLVGEKVAAVDRVVEMLPGGVAFALEILALR